MTYRLLREPRRPEALKEDLRTGDTSSSSWLSVLFSLTMPFMILSLLSSAMPVSPHDQVRMNHRDPNLRVAYHDSLRKAYVVDSLTLECRYQYDGFSHRWRSHKEYLSLCKDVTSPHHDRRRGFRWGGMCSWPVLDRQGHAALIDKCVTVRQKDNGRKLMHLDNKYVHPDPDEWARTNHPEY